jgi:hypothetical protein
MKHRRISVVAGMWFVLCVAIAFLCCILACSDDKGTTGTTTPQKDITFELTGSQTIQIWSEGKLTLRATAKSGEKPTLTATGVMGNASFLDNGNGTALIEFCPTKDQIGDYSLKIMAATSTEKDSAAVHLTVVDRSSLRKALLPVAMGNRWIYQSVQSRMFLDTVAIRGSSSDEGRIIWDGGFYPTLGMLSGGIVVSGDSIYSATLGIQFVIPDHVPAEIEINSRSTCYESRLSRRIEWSVTPVSVPAGVFVGCFKYSTRQESACENGGSDAIVEEIFIKPGVGIVKTTQIRSSNCAGACTSRWELLAWTIH